MIRHREGNILDDTAEALVCPVNCVGVMGAGLAKQFKERFPENHALYRIACTDGAVYPGRVFVTGARDRRPLIVNFPTKRHWRDPSDIVWIDDGLADLIDLIPQLDIRSIAVPMLGCGLGGLAWGDVRSLIKRWFSRVPDVDVRVYGPRA